MSLAVALKDVFFRPDMPVEVKPGDSYRRAHGKLVTETATVLDLKTDPAGIPHVRFRVRFERGPADHIETAMRMLSLGAFRTAYCERAI